MTVTGFGLVGVEAVAVGVSTGGYALLLPPPVTVPPAGHVLSTPWRAVAGATGARVGRALLTVDPVTSGDGRDVGVVAPAKQPTTSITVRPPDPRVPTRALTIPRWVNAPDGETFPWSADLHVVVRQNGQPVVAAPPLPAVGYVPAQLPGGSVSGSRVTLPDLLGDLTVTVVAGRSLDALTELPFAHGDVRLRAAPMPVGLHVDGPDGDEQLAVGGPVRSRVSHDLAPALQRHLAAAVRTEPGGSAPVTLRSDVVGDAHVQLDVRDVVIERALDGRLTVECDGSPTSVVRPGVAPGRAPTRTRADVTVTHHGAALHPASDPVPTADADLGGPAVRDEPVTRRVAAATLAAERLVRVGVVGWPSAGTDLSLAVLGRTLTATGLVGPAGRSAPQVVWFDLGGPVAVDGPLEVTLRATRGTFGWLAAPEPALRLAVEAPAAGAHVTVGGLTLTLTGPETHVPGASLAGTDGWDVSTDQLVTVALSSAVMEFAP
ncbi:hypothetical protein [Cellulomonas palmilytica]|uniref:hypothetical protein n=1 Tax=Cellulomonas palmilytica TaxID=2608402 RepID=UPI001F18B3C5|nr:hypothetical protein [Cellulomonas palmilytica]UJP39272.1 hypothetical protein F1D97_13105 [Cellulomonas palmilytica]